MKEVRLPVYYGWAKLNKIAKREALVVIYLNDNSGARVGKDGTDGVSRYMHICFKRPQTHEEQIDAKKSNRLYTVYNIFMDDKNINGSLCAALEANYNADCNNVSVKTRKEIKERLRKHYLSTHPAYEEPTTQLRIPFEW